MHMQITYASLMGDTSSAELIKEVSESILL
jgi:hypothetical protein